MRTGRADYANRAVKLGILQALNAPCANRIPTVRTGPVLVCEQEAVGLHEERLWTVRTGNEKQGENAVLFAQKTRPVRIVGNW